MCLFVFLTNVTSGTCTCQTNGVSKCRLASSIRADHHIQLWTWKDFTLIVGEEIEHRHTCNGPLSVAVVEIVPASERCPHRRRAASPNTRPHSLKGCTQYECPIQRIAMNKIMCVLHSLQTAFLPSSFLLLVLYFSCKKHVENSNSILSLRRTHLEEFL